MCKAAAEGAAVADRGVAHEARDLAEQAAERATAHHALKSRVPHRRADTQRTLLHQKAVEFADAIDVDEMTRPSHPERHHRNETLPPSNHATVLASKFGEQRYRHI